MKKLNQIANIKMGLVLNRKKAYLSDEQKHYYKVVSLKAFDDFSHFEDSQVDEFISNESIKNDFMVSRGDILLRLRAPYIAVHVEDEFENLIYSSLMVRIKLTDKNYDERFIAHFLNSRAVKKALSTEQKSTTIPTLNVADLSQIEVPTISLERQKTLVTLIELARHEQRVLNELIKTKEKFVKDIFEKSIGENR